MKNKLIVFEGIDATGKTSIAKELAKQINGFYYYTPPVSIYSLRAFADNSAPIVRYYYYVWGNHVADSEINELLKKGHVVCDWYMYATVAYHSILLKRNLKPLNLTQPDYIIFTEANWGTVAERLSKRKKVSQYERLNFLKQVYKKYREVLDPLETVTRLDTSHTTVKEAVEKIRATIRL